MTERYLVIFEQGPTSFGAMSPELPGCFAVGASLPEVRLRFIEAAEAHLQCLSASGDELPLPGLATIDVPSDEPEADSTYMLERVTLTLPSFNHASAAQGTTCQM